MEILGASVPLRRGVYDGFSALIGLGGRICALAGGCGVCFHAGNLERKEILIW